ncbi:MAG TPA: gluconate 2-dehydrogenase subunit 3 family protein [Gemmatimonadaceae bacterium]
MTDVSRRKFIAAAGVGAASVWLTLEAHELLALGAQAAQAKQFTVLSAQDAADIEAAAAQIIPTDDTPGAREARVIYFIDRALGTVAKDQRPVFENGAKELRARAAKAQPGAKSFAALANDKQMAIIAALEKEKSGFFFALRYGTIAGMLGHPDQGANYNKVGWKLIGFDDRFSWSAPFGWYDRNA